MISKSRQYGNDVAVELFRLMRKENRILSNREIYSLMSDSLNLTPEEMKLKYKSGALVYQNHVQFGLLGLKVMGLVKQTERGKWVITDSGLLKSSLELDEYTNFQKDYWSKKSEEKKALKSTHLNHLKQPISFDKQSTFDEKYRIIAEILEQNKKILNYLMEKRED